jgi:hypothetical protein
MATGSTETLHSNHTRLGLAVNIGLVHQPAARPIDFSFINFSRRSAPEAELVSPLRLAG